MYDPKRPLAAALLAAACIDAFASCGAAFCSVNTSWDAQGAWPSDGTRLDLRYEAIRQDQPMSGGARVAFGAIPRHHDERSTLNRNWIFAIDRSLGADWSIGLSLPVVDRAHEHVHNHRGAKLPEAWSFAGAGDARMLLRRRLYAAEGEGPSVESAGITFGLKLPTGLRDERNGEGALAERSLQPGTGTTDLLAGAQYSRALPADGFGWFVQGLAQLPSGGRDGYRPGSRLSADAGLRFELGDRGAAMLQLNALWRGRDAGILSEPDDTGGRALFASPGASFAFSREWQGYAFVQLPVAQHVNGVQLVARRALVFGASARF